MTARRWRAGFLPGLREDEVRWEVLSFSSRGQELQVEVPRLDEGQMTRLARSVRRGAREGLQAMPLDAVVDVLAQAVDRLLDPQDPARRELDELLPVVTGHDAEMVRLGLQACLHGFRKPQLLRFVAQDFANPKVLDAFQPAVKGGAVRAFGPALLAHVWAGNVPGLPLWSLASGLLVKAGSVGKLPSAEPVFASAFARVLAQVHPPLGDCLAVAWWPGGEPGASAALYRESEVVLAYGSNASLSQVRAEVPITTRFLGYGHKLGVALVGREALDTRRGPATARLAARDVVRWEQQGCYSPHVLYVERGAAIDPRTFAAYLAGELAQAESRHPRRELSLQEAGSVSAWRQAIEWRGLQAGAGELLGDEKSSWAVHFSEQPQPPAPTAGYRCITVSAVDSLDDVAPLLEPHAAVLQTAGVAVAPSALYWLAESLGRAGITRIAPLGGMAQPEPGWHHDGRFNLLDLVRMVEIEQGAEGAADRLAPTWQEDRP